MSIFNLHCPIGYLDPKDKMPKFLQGDFIIKLGLPQTCFHIPIKKVIDGSSLSLQREDIPDGVPAVRVAHCASDFFPG